jgi:hypothetical protein
MLIWRFLCYYSFIVIGVLIYGFNAVVRLRENHRAKKLSQEAE